MLLGWKERIGRKGEQKWFWGWNWVLGWEIEQGVKKIGFFECCVVD